MKKISKILITILCLFVTLPNVEAAKIPGPEQVRTISTLTVSGIQQTDTFKAYKILDAYYEEGSNIYTYHFTKDFFDFLKSTTNYNDLTEEQYQALTSGDITNGSTRTTSTLDTLVSQYASYIKTNNVTGTNMTVSGTNATATLEAGSWLVLPTSTTKVYAVMVGNIEFKANANGTDWDITSPTIVAKVSSAAVSKVLKNSSSTEDTYNKDDEFTFAITASIPTYPTNATNKTLTIKETLDNGIDLKSISSIVVKDGGTTLSTKADGTVVDTNNHTVGTITQNGKEITMTFNADYISTNTLTIEYTAKLNDNEVLGPTGNKSTTTLTYATEPYGTNSTTTQGVVNTIRTYGINLFKHDNSNTGLQGAIYNVYSDSGLTTSVGTITTGTNGHGIIEGLEAGNYYLKEVKAPTGYKINSDILTVSIDTTKNYTEATQENAKIGLLPSTGGIGTYIFIVIGAILVVGAIIFLYKYLNKNKHGK